MDVVRCDHARPDSEGGLGHGVVAVPVERVAVIAQLYEHPVGPEGVEEPEQLVAGRRRAVGGQRPRHYPFAAAGEDEPVVVPQGGSPAGGVHGGTRRRGEVGHGCAGGALLAGELRPADRPGEPRVPDGPLGEDHEVVAGRIGHPAGRSDRPEGDLRPEDRGQAERPGGLGEADDPVETVVIGDRQPGQAQARRLLGQLLGVAGTVEEREVRVAVQLGVRRHLGYVISVMSSRPRAGAPQWGLDATEHLFDPQPVPGRSVGGVELREPLDPRRLAET